MESIAATGSVPSPATLAAQAARRVEQRENQRRLQREKRHEALCLQLLEFPGSDKKFKATIVRRTGSIVRVRVQRVEFDVPFTGKLASGQRLLSVRIKNTSYDHHSVSANAAGEIEWLVLEWVPPAKPSHANHRKDSK